MLQSRIHLNAINYTFNKETRTFTTDETQVKFQTVYELYNSKSGNSMKFDLSH